MSADIPPVYTLPNKMGRILLLGIQEILGTESLNEVLASCGLPAWSDAYPANDMRREFAFSDISGIQTTLEQMYGLRGGRGVALRAGRAAFKFGLRQFGEQLGLNDASFRLLPMRAKLPQGAEILASLFNQTSDQRVRVETHDAIILWHIERCPVCWERRSPEPLCHLAVGILQEALYWLSGGKSFLVEETACIARGDPACTIAINRQPLDAA